MPGLLVRDVDVVLTMDEAGRVLRNASILVEDGVITWVGEGRPKEAADRVVEGRGMVALPGLIDTHTHLSQTIQRGLVDDVPLMKWMRVMAELSGRVSEELCYMGILLCLLEKLKNGITTTLAMAGEYERFDEVELAAKAVEATGIRAALACVLIDYQELPSPGVPAGSRISSPEEEVRKAEEWYRRFDGGLGGRLRVFLGPQGFPASSPELLREAAYKARELGTRVHAHVAEAEVSQILCRRRYGKSEVEMLEDVGFLGEDSILAHCVQISGDDAKIIAKYGSPVAHCPSSNLKLGNGIPPIHTLLKEGGTVTLGVDGAASNNAQDLFYEMRLASLLQKGVCRDPSILPAEKVLEMATRDAAQALGIRDIGSLKPGHRADIILIDRRAPHLIPHQRITSHLVYNARGSDVRTVIVDGRLIVHEGRFLPFDEQGFLEKFEEMMTQYLGETRVRHG